MPGKTMMLTAKISGIMPAELTLQRDEGRVPTILPAAANPLGVVNRDAPLPFIDQHDPDDGDQRDDSKDDDPDDVVATPSRRSRADRRELGRLATMPPKMMIETPLPIPISVINSPIQTSNIVPAVIESRIGESTECVVLD